MKLKKPIIAGIMASQLFFSSAKASDLDEMAGATSDIISEKIDKAKGWLEDKRESAITRRSLEQEIMETKEESARRYVPIESEYIGKEFGDYTEPSVIITSLSKDFSYGKGVFSYAWSRVDALKIYFSFTTLNTKDGIMLDNLVFEKSNKRVIEREMLDICQTYTLERYIDSLIGANTEQEFYFSKSNQGITERPDYPNYKINNSRTGAVFGLVNTTTIEDSSGTQDMLTYILVNVKYDKRNFRWYNKDIKIIPGPNQGE
jgi:hypothetical protein